MKKRRKPDVFGEWISVEDRLPRMGHRVLSYGATCQNIVETNCRCRIQTLGERPGWIWHIGYQITHWMPLPKPPKKGRR